MKTSIVCTLFALSLAITGLAWAQPSDEYVSGLLHQPLGGITSFSVTNRTLSACCLGSSGEDGVEVQFDSVYGGGVTVDLSELEGPSPVSREIRIRPKGWDGTIKGTVRLIGETDGTLTEVQDFTTSGVTSMSWRALGADAAVLDHGEVSGSVVTMVFDVYPSAKVFAVERSASGSTVENKNLFIEFVATVSGLTGTPISGVREIVVRPEPCAGCMNPWEDVQSLMVTGSEISEVVVSDAHLRTFGVQSWAIGDAHITEDCTYVGPCDADGRGLVIDNLGSSGEDGVSIVLGSGGGGGGGSGGEVARKKCPDCLPGHVIIMKLYDDSEQEVGRVTESSNPGTGQGVMTPDFSALGSTEFDVAYIGTDGTTLAVERCSNGTDLDAPNPDTGCSPDGHDVWRLSDGDSDVHEKRFCEPSGALALPSGAGVSSVAAMRLRAVDPSVVHQGVHRLAITSPDPDPIVIEDVTVHRSVYASGIPHEALGEVSSLSVDGRRLTACCLGSSGEDGVEVRLDSKQGGGASIDMAPMLGATGVAREVHVHPRDRFGNNTGSLRLASDVDGHLTEIYDFTTIGASSLEWRVLNAHGGVLAEGAVAGPVISWGLDAVATGAAPNKQYRFQSDGSVVHQANEGFFDLAVTVTGLTGTPISGAHAIEVKVEPCAGCPNGPDIDLHAVDFDADGLDDIVVTDAHLRTFGLECWGVGQAHVSEQCSNPLVPCDGSSSVLAVANLGSSGDDGVSVDLGGGSSGGEVSYRKKCKDCLPGHVIIMKLYDDEGGETLRVTHTTDPLTGEVELLVDPAGQGATETVATLFDNGGGTLGAVVLDAASSLTYPQCATGAPESWSWLGSQYTFHECSGGADFTLPGGGGVVAGVASVTFEPVSPPSPRASTRAVITSDDPSGVVIESVVATPAEVGDIDRDGDVDLVDYSEVAACLGGPGAAAPPTCDSVHFRRCDVDADVDVDAHDYAAFQRAIPSD